MVSLRWVAVSDLHLGALNSVLTSVAEDGQRVAADSVSPVIGALAECIRELTGGAAQSDGETGPPELVVLGDLFELALTSTETAAATFGQFISALRIGTSQAAVGRRLRFIPGNHDHRLWTQARDAHHLSMLQGLAGDDVALPESSHATELLPERERVPVRDAFVEVLAARAAPEAGIVVEQSYPNLGMLADGGRRAVVLSHGHYVEPLYRLMSNLDVAFGLKPSNVIPQVAHIEADNGGWIDFFWSSMGDSGDVTGIVRNLYESLQSKETMEAEIAAVERFVKRRYPGPRGAVESRAIGAVLKREVAEKLQRERHRPDVTLSAAAQLGLGEFIAGPVRAQLPAEPEHLTFVFGHTHKPFVEMRAVDGFAAPVSIVNTGGWVVDSVEPEATKGAALVLVDWDAHVAVVRCYVQGAEPSNYRVTVTSGDPPGAPNPLAAALTASIDPAADPWLSLGEALSEIVAVRARQLGERIAVTASSLHQERGRT